MAADPEFRACGITSGHLEPGAPAPPYRFAPEFTRAEFFALPITRHPGITPIETREQACGMVDDDGHWWTAAPTADGTYARYQVRI